MCIQIMTVALKLNGKMTQMQIVDRCPLTYFSNSVKREMRVLIAFLRRMLDIMTRLNVRRMSRYN